MELLVEFCHKNHLNDSYIDGIILPLEHYSVESMVSFSMEEIKKIQKEFSCKVFVKINRNLLNQDIEVMKDILIELDQCKIDGIFFYDLAILQLKKELGLSIPLVWNQTHMVNNYRSCEEYYQRGVEYALLGKEITLEEIKEIQKKSHIQCMVEVVSRPSIAFSRRKLISHFYDDLGKVGDQSLRVTEKVSSLPIDLIESEDGTSFFSSILTNGTSIIQDLFEAGIPYIIMREFGIEEFDELVKDTKEYLLNCCQGNEYVMKYKKLGDCTNFFFQKTIYKVKKNG